MLRRTSIRRRPQAGGCELLDRRGRPRPVICQPGYKAGQAPPNANRRFPAEILTSEEIRRLIAACPRRGKAGIRNRAMIVLMWRGGLRCKEVLDLEPRDADPLRGTVTVRHGKGNRRRVIGLDPPAFAVLDAWLEVRRGLGVPRGKPLFCTITKGNVGSPVKGSYWRQAITRLGKRAGIEKRVHSHGLRHTHATELMRERVPIVVIQRQIGHSSLATTQRYVDHLEPQVVVETMQRREWPLEHQG